MATRISALSDTFKSYGAEMTEVFGMETPASFNTDPDDEHDAIREAMGLWDSSVVHKIHVRGADALEVINYVAASDVHKISVGEGRIVILLHENGHIDDDAIVMHLDEDHYILSISDGDGQKHLEQAAAGKNAGIEYDSDTHIVALQGPKSVSLLDKHCEDDVKQLKFFNFIKTRLFGEEIILSRTGFSGERGYEFLVGRESVVSVFTQLVKQGEPMGLKLCAFESINKARLEAGLPIGGMDFSPENSPWEVGYGWAVSSEKEEFLGRDSVLALKGNEKVLLTGVVAAHSGPVDWGAVVQQNGEDVGKITSSCYSRRMGKSIALAQLIPEAAIIGAEIKIIGGDVSCSGKVVSMPLHDPEKLLLRAN